MVVTSVITSPKLIFENDKFRKNIIFSGVLYIKVLGRLEALLVSLEKGAFARTYIQKKLLEKELCRLIHTPI